MNWKNQKLKKLATAFASLKDPHDIANFLRDLCTIEELEELSNRWEVVEMLIQNMSYREISEKTGMSTTTVTRIAFWLKHGEGGYQKVLKNLKK